MNFLVGGKGDSFTSILNITPHGTIRKENMDSWTGIFCKFFRRLGLPCEGCFLTTNDIQLRWKSNY